MQVLGEGKYLKLVKQDNWEWAKRPQRDVVAVLPVTDDGEIIFITQYRVPVDSQVVEIPAGLVGDVRHDETPEESIRAELLEETGYQAENIYELGYSPTSPGLTDECTRLYIAQGLTKVAQGGGDDSENIEVHKVETYTDVYNWLKNKARDGYIIDMKVYAALYLAYEGGWI